MTKTFTSIELTAKPTKSGEATAPIKFAEPSDFTIQNILNFSKNLEVRSSGYIKEIQFLKS